MSKKAHRKRKPSKWKRAGFAGLTAGKWFLEFLGAMIELMPTIETPRAYVRRIDGWPKEIPRRHMEQELRRMKDRGWIVEAEQQGKRFIKLTEKGHMEILYRKLKTLSGVSGRKWDGTWWMALFDIPEKGRAERDAIRKALITAGFHRLQKSVYVYPDELPNELVGYLRAAKLLSYIRFAHVDRMDGVGDLKRHFKISRL